MDLTNTANIPFTLTDKAILRQQSYVNGEWVEARSGNRFHVIDPGTDTVWASCPDNGPEDVDSAVVAAEIAFQSYRKMVPRKRAQLLMAWHNLIVQGKEDLANIVTYETGKPLAESRGEVDAALGIIWWFAGEAERIHGSLSTAAAPNRRIMIVKQPIGVAVALVPWNFPFAMVARKVPDSQPLMLTDLNRI